MGRLLRHTFCDDCQAPTFFARTEQAHMRQLDVDPDPEHGTVVLDGHPEATIRPLALILGPLEIVAARDAGETLWRLHDCADWCAETRAAS